MNVKKLVKSKSFDTFKKNYCFSFIFITIKLFENEKATKVDGGTKKNLASSRFIFSLSNNRKLI